MLGHRDTFQGRDSPARQRVQNAELHFAVWPLQTWLTNLTYSVDTQEDGPLCAEDDPLCTEAPSTIEPLPWGHGPFPSQRLKRAVPWLIFGLGFMV